MCLCPQVFDESEDLDADEMPAAAGQTFEKLNWLQAGFLSSDKLLTVSPNYAEEITSDPEKGVELDGIIRCAGLSAAPPPHPAQAPLPFFSRIVHSCCVY